MEKVEVDRFLSMKFYGARGKKWETIPPWGTAVDIFIGWNFNVLEMVQLEKGQYSVSSKVRIMADGCALKHWHGQNGAALEEVVQIATRHDRN